MNSTPVIVTIWSFAVPAAVSFVTALLTLFFKPFFDERLETHKWKLKKKELLLDREIEAAKEFQKIRNKLLSINLNIDPDQYDIACDVIYNLSMNQNIFETFLEKHQLFISDEARKKILSLANVSIVETVFDGVTYDSITESEEKLAQILIKDLDPILNLIISQLKKS